MPVHVDARYRYVCNMPASRNVDIADAYSTYFNGSNEYAQAADFAKYDWEHTQPQSMACWFKTSDATGTGYLMGKLNSSGTGFGISVEAAPYAGRIGYRFVAAPQAAMIAGDTVVNNGVWHHVVATYDGSALAAGITIYVDGGSAEAPTVVQDNLVATIRNLNKFQINGRTGANLMLTAYQDECAIWDKELSAGEAAEVYNGGVPADLRRLSSAANLKGWWRMGDGDVSPTILDWSTSGFDLTTTNMDATNFVLDVP